MVREIRDGFAPADRERAGTAIVRRLVVSNAHRAVSIATVSAMPRSRLPVNSKPNRENRLLSTQNESRFINGEST